MKNRSYQPYAAFSLIEVVLAIGILAMAVIPLMALLPVGFSSYREASDSMTQTAIARYVASSLGSMSPTNWQTNDIYFSDEMTTLSNSNSVGVAYRVCFSTSNALGFDRENIPIGSTNYTTFNRFWKVSYQMWDVRNNRNLGTGGFGVVDREGATN